MSNICCVYGSIKVLFSCFAVPFSTTRGPMFSVGSAEKHKHKVGTGALQWDFYGIYLERKVFRWK